MPKNKLRFKLRPSKKSLAALSQKYNEHSRINLHNIRGLYLNLKSVMQEGIVR